MTTLPIDLIPAIDLRNGAVVRLRRGDYSQQTTYPGDPVDTAKSFQDAGCKWLHVVDLDGAKEGKPINLATIEKIIRGTQLKVEVGGGIRTEEAMEYCLAIGAERLILGTRALDDMPWFEAMAKDTRFKNRLILGLDAKDGLVSTHGWTHTPETAKRAIDLAQEVSDWPLAALIYTDIARDGMMKGANVRATARLTKVCKKLPVIHSGGVTTMADIIALKALPIAGMIVGKALYEGTINLADAVRELAAPVSASAAAQGEIA
jgi:phosphoribosylformimino-5-aminoimidazole carboxamide ribotide isomerase